MGWRKNKAERLLSKVGKTCSAVTHISPFGRILSMHPGGRSAMQPDKLDDRKPRASVDDVQPKSMSHVGDGHGS